MVCCEVFFYRRVVVGQVFFWQLSSGIVGASIRADWLILTVPLALRRFPHSLSIKKMASGLSAVCSERFPRYSNAKKGARNLPSKSSYWKRRVRCERSQTIANNGICGRVYSTQNKNKKQSFGDAFESCGAKTNKGQIVLNI